RGAVDNADDLQSQVALLSRHLSEAQEMLEQREHDLRRALKRLDRKLCPTVRGHERDEPRAGGDANNGSGATSPTAAAGTTDGSHAAAAAAAATEPPSAADTPSAGPAATNGCAAPEASAQKAQQALADYKLLAEQRLAEIEERMRENTELVMQVDSLRLQIASVPDYIISETALYKQVEAGRNHYGTQAQRLQAEVDRLLAEAGELRTTRGAFEEGVVAEASAQRTALETELQRLQNDLVRVRHHRDQMQRELEERRAQDAVEDQKSTELKLLSDVRRERMNALISENKRLLAYIAIQRGDRAAFETYTDEELSKATAVADELRAKLEQMTRRERHLSDKLGALSVRGDGDNDGNTDGESGSLPPEQQQSPASDVARLLGELQDAQDKLARFQQRVQKYEEILGGALVDGQGSVVADAAAQGCELAAKQRRIDELVLERDGLAKTSEMMERELQTICESFAKLEEQNTSKVWDLGQKEQVIARVIAEKSKYEEKFIGLNKDREAQRLANQALRAQSAKQLEHIKAIEERDRALAQQLSLLESEAQHATQAWHASQTQLLETQRQTQALEEQARALEDKARAATAALGERTEALEAAEHARRRVEETLAAATAQRGAEADKPTDETGLAKLCADYKALL
ncbi:E3 ubiquitin-protein ligase bre1, partial [Coemansia helicoidea]